jgi:hypothetical protein
MGGLFLLLVPFASLLFPEPAKAQCGASASSCKDCHEVQAKAPVNNDGTRWHQSHAFGDFCVFCHAGNQQATVKDAAHVDLVPPLFDVKAACQSCHSSDLQARVEIYASILKVTPGTSNTGNAGPSPAAPTILPAQSGPPTTPQPTVGAPATSIPTTSEIVVNDPNVIDYVERYDEIVLGKYPTNWGNVTLLALIGLLAVGGIGFVVLNEVRISRALRATQQVEGEYPVEVVAMLPAITSLKPQSRKSLRNILNHPKKTDKILGTIDALVSDENTEE